VVSVIVPLYNYSQYIGDCIQSILNQTYRNIELIVVDDCSTDSSLAAARKYEKDNVHVISLRKNRGYSAAKNEGIIRSSGNIIITLDADDMLTPTSVEERVEEIEYHNIPFVHGLAFYVDGDISLEDCYKKESIFKVKGLPIHAQGVAMRREVYKKYGLYEETMRATADKEFWWRLFGQKEWTGRDDGFKPKIRRKLLGEPVAYYRKHKNSMWWKKKRNLDGYNRKSLDDMCKYWYKRRWNEGINAENTRML